MAELPPALKVCHVFAHTEGGVWAFDQSRSLRDDHGCAVTALLGGTEGSTVELFRRAGIPFRSADFVFGRWRALFAIPLAIARLAWWMRRSRFDVVQSHVITSTLLARPAAWLADVPVRVEMVTSPYYMRATGTRRLQRATAWMETSIVPSCDLTGELYRSAGIDPERIESTLYYGPPEDRFDPARTTPAGLRRELGLPPDTPLIGSVAHFYARRPAGRMVPPEVAGRHLKGHVELIEAMPAILTAYPRAKLLLIGKGWGEDGCRAEAELRALVEARGLGGAVIFTGHRSDIAEIYMDLDVSVQASLLDNLGGTIESLLMARPTVAARAGGMVDSVVDGETGLLAAPSNAADLAEKIIYLLRHPDEARRMGEAGRARMLSSFTLRSTAAGLAALYRRRRGEAAGAWRLHVTLARLFVAALLYLPLIAWILLPERDR